MLIKNKLRTSTVLFLDVACHRGACSANVRVPLYEDMEGTTTKAEASGAKFKNHFFAAETDSNTRPKIHASESERGTIKFSLKPAKYGVKKQPPAVNTVTEKTSIHVASAVSYVRSVASEMSVISEQKTRIVDGPGLKKSHTSDKAYSSSFSSSKWKQTTVEKKGSSPIKTTEVTKDLSENYISSSSPVKASNKNRDQYHVSEIGVTSEKSLADGPKHQQHDRPKRSRSFFSPDEKSVSQKKHVIERSDQYVSTNYHRSLFKQTEATYTSASETLQSTSENCEGLYNYSNQGERTLNTSESSRNTWQYSEHVQNNDDFKISEGNNPISDREHDKKKKKRRTKPPKGKINPCIDGMSAADIRDYVSCNAISYGSEFVDYRSTGEFANAIPVSQFYAGYQNSGDNETTSLVGGDFETSPHQHSDSVILSYNDDDVTSSQNTGLNQMLSGNNEKVYENSFHNMEEQNSVLNMVPQQGDKPLQHQQHFKTQKSYQQQRPFQPQPLLQPQKSFQNQPSFQHQKSYQQQQPGQQQQDIHQQLVKYLQSLQSPQPRQPQPLLQNQRQQQQINQQAAQLLQLCQQQLQPTKLQQHVSNQQAMRHLRGQHQQTVNYQQSMQHRPPVQHQQPPVQHSLGNVNNNLKNFQQQIVSLCAASLLRASMLHSPGASSSVPQRPSLPKYGYTNTNQQTATNQHLNLPRTGQSVNNVSQLLLQSVLGATQRTGPRQQFSPFNRQIPSLLQGLDNANCFSNQTSGLLTSQNQSFHSTSPVNASKSPDPTVSEVDNTSELTHRKWEYVGSQDSSRTGMEFTVMTYNILSQELLVQHPYLYRECRERDIDWANRCSLLIRQILTHNADIICLQEVQEDHWHHDILRPLVKNGYKGVYKKKVDDKVDGCAILYKHSKFRQLNFIPVEFKRGGILDRDNVGIILLLQPLQAGRTCQKICVATTHLLFNPRRGDVKLAQLMVFLAEIDKYAHETHKKLDKPGTHSGSASTSQPEALNYCPIILCGDFNSTPASDLYDLIIRGHLKYEGLASRSVCGQEEGAEGGRGAMLRKALLPQELDITQGCQYMSVVKERSLEAEIHPERLKVNSGEIFHKMNFISVYPHHRSNRDEITTYHSKSSAVVDYIFYSNQNMEQVEKVDDGGGHRLPAAPEPLTLLARYKLMNYKHVRRIGFFPNSIFPSDHLCLIARFLLRTFIYL
ncbi:uncharacterized protein LOC131944919 isoform X2 [Physella acuta]|uniref:uncharacterized protein LOC131944919 isoform X2 n=1 Tax=Physella acuta TaxID=109671 RepID=UPI0027DB53CB|nr:uncharacterized protein LOC131944919 isoform X2 [Physella acuta]